MIKASLKKSIEEIVVEQLRPYQKGIRRKELYELFEQTSTEKGLVLIEVIKGKLQVKHSLVFGEIMHRRLLSMLTYLHHLLKKLCLPQNLVMVFSLEDTLSLSVPFFSATKKAGQQVILFNDLFITNGRQVDMYWHVRRASQAYPWPRKIPKAFWRGSTTGGPYLQENWDHLVRPRLVRLSEKYPDRIDAQFTEALDFVREEEIPIFIQQYPLAKKVSVRDHLRYKYLIDVEGNTCNDSRTYWMLFANSLWFQQEMDYQFWFSDWILPFKHFVPFKRDLSDLLEKIEWAESHPEECLEIIRRSTSLAHDLYHFDTQMSYTSTLLTHYASLLD